jgi:type IV secretory pathway VirB4 component
MTALHKAAEWLEAVACGVILRRDGRLQRTARLGGPDLKTAPPAELVGMWDRINDSLRALGPGWLVLIQTGRDVTRVVGRWPCPMRFVAILRPPTISPSSCGAEQ